MNEFIIQWYSKSIFNFQHFEIKQLFRKIETKSKQLITNNLHQEFNNICLNENLLPIYTNYIYILAPIWGGSGTRSPLIFWDTFLRYLRILFYPKKEKMIIMTKIGKKSCPQKGSVPFMV